MYHKEQFLTLPFNPLVVARGDTIWETYPELKKKLAFTEPIEGESEKVLDLILRFIIIFVSKKSPLYFEKDFNTRIDDAFTVLGISRSSKAYEYITSNNEWYMNLLYEFFKYVNDLEYEMWFSLKMNLHNSNNLLRVGATTAAEISALKGLSKELPEMTSQMMEIQQRLFPDERTLEIINNIAISDRSFFAEAFAKHLEI